MTEQLAKSAGPYVLFTGVGIAWFGGMLITCSWIASGVLLVAGGVFVWGGYYTDACLPRLKGEEQQCCNGCCQQCEEENGEEEGH